MAIKAVVTVGVSAHDLADLVTTRDFALAKRFNPTLDGGRDLEWRDGRRERISHVLTKPVLWLKARDFVLRVRRDRLADGTELITNADTVHPDVPPTAACVRGSIEGMHLVEPITAGQGPACKYTCVHQMDPRGAVPLWVVNWFAVRRPLQYMSALRTVAEERHAST